MGAAATTKPTKEANEAAKKTKEQVAAKDKPSRKAWNGSQWVHREPNSVAAAVEEPKALRFDDPKGKEGKAGAAKRTARQPSGVFSIG